MINLCVYATALAVSFAAVNATVWRNGGQAKRHVEGSVPDRMNIPLLDHQFIRVEVIQNAGDLAVKFRDPDGKSLIEVDSDNDRYGPETVVAISESAGNYTLEVRLSEPPKGSSTYEVLVKELREARPEDTQTVRAHRDYAEGVRLSVSGTPEDRKHSIEKLRLSLDSFQRSGDTYMQALALVSLGFGLASSGEFREAARLSDESADLFGALKDMRGEAKALNNYAGFLEVLGEPQKALENHRHALALYRSVGDHGQEALLLNNIGFIEYTLSEWQEAIDDYRRSLVLSGQVGDHALEASVLSNLGLVYRGLGATDLALDLFDQSLSMARASGDKRGEAVTLGALASMYLSLRDMDKAIGYQRDALAMLKSLGDRRGQAEALTLLGRAYAELGRAEQAQEYLQQSLNLSREVGDRREIGTAMISFANTFLKDGEVAKASDWGTQAADEFHAIGDQRYEAVSLEAIARAESAKGNLQQARKMMEEALRLAEQSRKGVGNEELRASFFATHQDAYSFYIDVLMRTGGAESLALETNERSRARSLLEMLMDSGADIREGVDPKLAEREREIANLLNAKGSILLSLLGKKDERVASISGEIRALEFEYQDVQAAIRKSSPRYAAITQPMPLSLRQIQAQVLDKDTVLLEYNLGEKRSYLWSVTTSDLNTWELPARDEIEKRAHRVYTLLTARSATVRGETESEAKKRIAAADAALPSAARDLSDAILTPVLGGLGRKRLAIVADGELQRIPFAILPEPRSPDPLIERHEVVMLPSASALAILRSGTDRRKPAPKAVAAIGDPVFDDEDPRAGGGINQVSSLTTLGLDDSRLLQQIEVAEADHSRVHIPRLPFTSIEIERILRTAPDPSNLEATGFQASRALALSGNLRDYRYLHFATHGYLDTDHPGLSALVLSQIDERHEPRDGFLRVNDIYNLRLSADLVVLSACDTGLGKEVRGEGLMGLTRAFMYAGASRVVVSLWSVNDRATADLMSRFYLKMLRKGRAPNAALREAQLELRTVRRYQSPYYWAAFVQQGEWRP